MKVLNGSPVLLRGGDGRKAHLVDMVLTPGDMILNPSLIAICFIKFDDGAGWWHGPSYMLAPDTDGVFLDFEQHEHLRRLMSNLPVEMKQPRWRKIDQKGHITSDYGVLLTGDNRLKEGVVKRIHELAPIVTHYIPLSELLLIPKEA